jgi:hypothetical protein
MAAKGQIEDKSCLMTNHTGESVMTGRPNTTAGLPESELTHMYIPYIVSGEILPLLKKC